MNQHEVNTREVALEDLTVKEAGSIEVKGGAQIDYFLKLKGIDGDATDAQVDSGYDLQSK